MILLEEEVEEEDEDDDEDEQEGGSGRGDRAGEEDELGREWVEWRETLTTLCFTIPRVVAQPAAQVFVRATQLFIPCL